MSVFTVLSALKDPCTEVTCTYGSTCVQSSDGLSAKCMCPLGCVGKPQQTVCGSDGKDYRNECELHQQACKHQRNIRVQYQGPCGEFPRHPWFLEDFVIPSFSSLAPQACQTFHLLNTSVHDMLSKKIMTHQPQRHFELHANIAFKISMLTLTVSMLTSNLYHLACFLVSMLTHKVCLKCASNSNSNHFFTQ